MSAQADIFDTLAECPSAGLARFAETLDPEWIEQALNATGTASIRRRKMPAEQVVWLVIGMALFADRSLDAIVDHLRLILPGVEQLTRGAISQARYRLGKEPIRWLFHTVAQHWAVPEPTMGYRGMALYAIDGTSMRVPDSDENFAHFGKHGSPNGSGDSGYPQLRMATLMELGSRLICDAEFAPSTTSEYELAWPLWDQIPNHSLTILDRGFINYRALAKLLGEGKDRHLLLRLKSTTRCRQMKELPDGTAHCVLQIPTLVRRQYPDLPEELPFRVIAYQNPGGEPSRLLTSLRDETMYPAAELIQLYHDRWEIELGYDEVKIHMLERKESLRSQKVEGVQQEVWGLLLTYNLIRREMLLAARAHEVSPRRMSFRSSLLWIRTFWLTAARIAPGTIPRHLGELRSSLQLLVLPPRRTERRYPRHVKIKMSNFKRNRGKRRPKEKDKST